MIHTERASSRFQALSRAVTDAWQRWRELGNLNDYWQRCPAEADRLALDMGLQQVELRQLSRRRSAWHGLLGGRLEILGVDPRALERDEPEYARDLARVCALCDSKARCAHDLKRRPESGIWRTYCPNEQTINQIMSDDVVDRMRNAIRNKKQT
jgi:hypothetical protein